MAGRFQAELGGRAVLRLSGTDARGFLQNLVTNDVACVGPQRSVYAALLTPQGKYLFDFFVCQLGDDLLLEAEAGRLAELAKRLAMYRLRAKVEIAADESLRVFAAWGEGAAEALGLRPEAGATAAFAGGIAFVDPRLAAAGARVVAPLADGAAALGNAGFATGGDYERHRLALGLPDSSRDLEVDRTIALEANFEELNGVDFKKGCFVGQEVTARSKYRGLVKKRLLPVGVEGPLPAPDTAVTLGGKEAGTVRSGAGAVALALLRLEAIREAEASGQPLLAGAARLRPIRPSWDTESR
jgi:hypothetical protein